MTSLGKSDIDTPESLSSEMSEDAEIDQQLAEEDSEDERPDVEY